MSVAFGMNAVTAQSITGNESETNMTTEQLLQTVNMTNTSTPMINNIYPSHTPTYTKYVYNLVYCVLYDGRDQICDCVTDRV